MGEKGQKASLVFIPFPVVSHLVAAVKASELLASRDSRLSITVLVMSMPTDTKISSYIKNPQINFVRLKQDDESGSGEEAMKPPKSMFHFAGSHKASVKGVVSEMKKCRRVAGIFIDIMCVDMIDVAKKLGVSSYGFFASGAASGRSRNFNSGVPYLHRLRALKSTHHF